VCMCSRAIQATATGMYTCVCEREEEYACWGASSCERACVFVPFRLLPQVYTRERERERKSVCVLECEFV